MTAAIKGVHPLAEIWPKMIEDDFEDLVKSISENGLRNPIVITPDGLILDGRNRHAACKKAKVAPTTVVYEGEDLAEFILDANSSRRHMNSGARAMATAMTLAADGRRKDGKWAYGAAKERTRSGTSIQRLTDCGLIIDYARDLAPKVVGGVETLDSALKKAKEKKAEKEQEEKDKKELEESGSKGEKFLRLVDDGELTIPSAAAAYRKENEKELKRKEEEHKALTDLYSGIASAFGNLSGYDTYDAETLMDKYNPEDLTPMEVGYFSVESLEASKRFAENMIEWAKNR